MLIEGFRGNPQLSAPVGKLVLFFRNGITLGLQGCKPAVQGLLKIRRGVILIAFFLSLKFLEFFFQLTLTALQIFPPAIERIGPRIPD
ncbi:MAG: hypothetical protein BWY42_01352 [Candidatus Omnitrophica bacterium ADurb.Bin277]|nr:MAG: hypothetical protein BWY42_01352 [Candidatus Omnitrophica bacterium ADurb.Bin277]